MTITEKAATLAAAGFPLGEPLAEAQMLDTGGYQQRFAGAILYQSPAGETFEVHGAILGRYLDLGETSGALGFPTSDEMESFAAPGGRMNMFEHGSIVWDARFGAQETAAADSGIADAGATDEAGAPDPAAEEPMAGNGEGVVTLPEVTITADGLAAKLQSVADYAYSILQMPLPSSKKLIFDAEHPADPANWCGNTLAHFYKHEGADKTIVNTYFGSTASLAAYGSYYRVGFDLTTGELVVRQEPAKDPKMVVDEAQVSVEEYHAQQGSARKIILFDEIQQGTPLDIMPGDIVLSDGRNKGGPDHIQLVYQWHEEDRTLIVIDGNGGGFALADYGATALVPAGATNQSHDKTLKTDKLRILADKLGTEVVFTNDQASGRVGITCHLLTAEHQVNPPADNPSAPHARVWAIIRPSAIDFEQHHYSNL
jgi:hypothetical protein